MLVAAPLLAGCYAGRAAWGGLGILTARRPVARLLADPATDPELARRLRTAVELRRFAVEELALPDNLSYLTYVELGREYAAWTVTAAPELSVEPKIWCFPFAGCVSYRGYFKQGRARRFAATLERRGWDVEVGGVAAYSTLGWFADPLLSSFLARDDAALAGLVFHELTHQRLYVAGDTVFNESLATAVEEEGVRRWLARRGRADELAAWLAERQIDAAAVELALATRDRLAEVYAAPRPEAWQRRRKAELLDELRAAYRERRDAWGGRWDGFFDQELNNARLASLGAYHELAPGFERLLVEAGGDFERFFATAAAVARLGAEERRRRLAAGR